MLKEKEELIEIPKEIQAEVERNAVKLKCQDREVSRYFKATGIKIEKLDNNLKITAPNPRKDNYAIMKTVASHIRNLIYGLKHGYEYKLEIVYSHFPMNVAVKEEHVEISNLAGEKKAIKAKIVGNASVEVKGKEIIVKAVNKEDAGQTAANLENATKLKHRDVRVFQDGIYIVHKPKIVAAAGAEEK